MSNKWFGIGRLTKDPDVMYTQGEKSMAIARYTLAVDRKFKKDGEPTADFISCVAFGKNGEFAEKYLRKGTKIAIFGRIQTGSYTNKDGQKVYTTDIVVEEHEFCEKKGEGESQNAPKADEGFMDIPGDVDSEIPWSDDIPFGN
jgi:single-strand DNA-binding protein